MSPGRLGRHDLSARCARRGYRCPDWRRRGSDGLLQAARGRDARLRDGPAGRKDGDDPATQIRWSGRDGRGRHQRRSGARGRRPRHFAGRRHGVSCRRRRSAIVDNDIRSVETAFDLAGAARRRVKQNNLLAFSYNGIALWHWPSGSSIRCQQPSQSLPAAVSSL